LAHSRHGDEQEIQMHCSENWTCELDAGGIVSEQTVQEGPARRSLYTWGQLVLPIKQQLSASYKS